MGHISIYFNISAGRDLVIDGISLKKIKSKFESFHTTNNQISKNPNEPVLYLYFPSQEMFDLAVQRDTDFYQRFLQILMKFPANERHLLYESSKNPTDNEDADIFCVLKYEMHDNLSTRNYIQLIYQVDQLIELFRENKIWKSDNEVYVNQFQEIFDENNILIY